MCMPPGWEALFLNFVELVSLVGFVEVVILFLYAVRWYLFASVVLRSSKSSARSSSGSGWGSVFVSVLLPVYNEPNVVDRLLKACTSFNSPPYEVVVVDDSDDDVTSRKLAAWQNRANVKVVHRDSRRGWKGGAMNDGLDKVDARSSHVLVLDADFVPPSDLVGRFVSRFDNDGVVAVQGYQRHDLNAEESWVSKGVRVWHCLYNMVELNGECRLGLFSPLTGSVFMARTDVLRKFRFDEALAEDTELTMRLCESGYKVLYDPSLAASGECLSSLRGLFRQQMRWAEGHTRVFRDHFWRMLKSRFLSVSDKINFLFVGFSYLNCVLIFALTVAWLLTLLFPAYFLPLPIVQAGFLLFLASVPSGVFSSLVALSVEGARKDFRKIPYAWVVNFALTPVVAVAALKGLFAGRGVFHRVYKTGKVLK
jgi:cellulose synthase/poly-beta-1,6-N-acetylglucosamine synthase-like glycosyltransferase